METKTLIRPASELKTFYGASLERWEKHGEEIQAMREANDRLLLRMTRILDKQTGEAFRMASLPQPFTYSEKTFENEEKTGERTRLGLRVDVLV